MSSKSEWFAHERYFIFNRGWKPYFLRICKTVILWLLVGTGGGGVERWERGVPSMSGSSGKASEEV